MTTNSALTVDYEIPVNVTANECTTISEASLRVAWPRPNLRTRFVLFLSRLGIGVRRFKGVDDLFVELNR